MILERSATGKSAKSVFFEDVNDIDIYIEDTAFAYEKFFTLIFSRVFEKKYKVRKVFPLGGRKEVISCYNFEKDNITRPFIFIVDGDLHMLAGDTECNKIGFYILPFYCIENILIDVNAFHDLLDEEEPVKSKDELISLFDFTDWINKNESKLFDLFLEYAITFKLNPEEKTVAYKIKDLVSSNNGCIDDIKLKKRIDDLHDKSILKVGERKYQETKEFILDNFSNSSFNKLDAISGKDYLFVLLKTRFKSIVNTKITDINFKHRLAKKCDIKKISTCLDYLG